MMRGIRSFMTDPFCLLNQKEEAVTFRQKRTKGASFIRTVLLVFVLSIEDEFEVENRDFIPVFPLFMISFCSIMSYSESKECHGTLSKPNQRFGNKFSYENLSILIEMNIEHDSSFQ